jgi:hypothetical protein
MARLRPTRVAVPLTKGDYRGFELLPDEPTKVEGSSHRPGE